MSLFRAKCPTCRSREHSDPKYHQEHFDGLITEVKVLQKRVAGYSDAELERGEPLLYQNMLQEALDELYVEAGYLKRTAEIPALLGTLPS